MKTPVTTILLALSASILLMGCEEKAVTTPIVLATATPVPKQVERLARPAINEGLVLTNASLNLWNSVGPDVDATSAAAGIAGEATAVLKAVGNSDAQVAAKFAGLLPDVMRIDTSRESGYAGNSSGATANVVAPASNSAGLMPVGGRKITDDTIDITLFVVLTGTPAAVPALLSDNVSYAGPNAGGVGHKPVKAAFPYLADPN